MRPTEDGSVELARRLATGAMSLARARCQAAADQDARDAAARRGPALLAAALERSRTS